MVGIFLLLKLYSPNCSAKTSPGAVVSPQGLTDRVKALGAGLEASFPLRQVGDLNGKSLPKRCQFDRVGAGRDDHKHALEDCLHARYCPLGTLVLNKERWLTREFQGLVENAVL